MGTTESTPRPLIFNAQRDDSPDFKEDICPEGGVDDILCPLEIERDVGEGPVTVPSSPALKTITFPAQLTDGGCENILTSMAEPKPANVWVLYKPSAGLLREVLLGFPETDRQSQLFSAESTFFDFNQLRYEDVARGPVSLLHYMLSVGSNYQLQVVRTEDDGITIDSTRWSSSSDGLNGAVSLDLDTIYYVSHAAGTTVSIAARKRTWDGDSWNLGGTWIISVPSGFSMRYQAGVDRDGVLGSFVNLNSDATVSCSETTKNCTNASTSQSITYQEGGYAPESRDYDLETNSWLINTGKIKCDISIQGF